MPLGLPISLHRAIEQRQLLPFIGAGFSKNISPELPSWSEVIRRSASLLEYDPDVLETQGDYLQIAEYLYIRNRLGDLYSELDRELHASRFRVSDSRPHCLLPHLDSPFIFTTNWDSWIERGFEHERIPYSKIITQADFATPRRWLPDATPTHARSAGLLSGVRRKSPNTSIVKFHGDFAVADSIVIRESHYYDRFDFEHALDIRLRAEMIGRSVMFIGYSFSDPNVRYLWHKLMKLTRESGGRAATSSYFVTHIHNPLLIELFESKNIETILLDPTDIGGDLERLLTDVLDRQSRS